MSSAIIHSEPCSSNAPTSCASKTFGGAPRVEFLKINSTLTKFT